MTPFRTPARLTALVALLGAAIGFASPARADPVPSAYASVGETGGIMAHRVDFEVKVRDAVAGHEYRLQCQYRLHTKAGEVGPLLGDRARPNGAVFDLGRLQPRVVGAGQTDPTSVELNARVDVTRKDLSGMTNLPPNAQDVVVRVEPQIVDVTTGKSLTVLKTDAVVLFLLTGPEGRVGEIRAFSQWFPLQFRTAETATRAIGIVGGIDAWEVYHVDVANGFEEVLNNAGVKPELKVLAIKALPARLLSGNNGLAGIMSGLTAAPDPALKAAAAAKIAEAKAAER